MSWTTPRTWVAGEVVTAAIMNTHVRDDLISLGRSLKGTVISNAVGQGAGFSVVRNSLGNYTVTFSVAFSAAPVVLCTPKTTVDRMCQTGSITTGSFGVIIYNGSGTLFDTDFHFYAFDPS